MFEAYKDESLSVEFQCQQTDVFTKIKHSSFERVLVNKFEPIFLLFKTM